MIPQKLKTLDQQPRDPDTVTSWESLNVFIHIALTIRMFFFSWRKPKCLRPNVSDLQSTANIYY